MSSLEERGRNRGEKKMELKTEMSWYSWQALKSSQYSLEHQIRMYQDIMTVVFIIIFGYLNSLFVIIWSESLLYVVRVLDGHPSRYYYYQHWTLLIYSARTSTGATRLRCSPSPTAFMLSPSCRHFPKDIEILNYYRQKFARNNQTFPFFQKKRDEKYFLNEISSKNSELLIIPATPSPSPSQSFVLIERLMNLEKTK